MSPSIITKNLTLDNVVCDNIKVVKHPQHTTLCASFGFSDRSGLYGQLLEAVKRCHHISACIIDPKCYDIHCTSLMLDPVLKVRGPNQGGSVQRVTQQALGELYESHPVFVATVDVTFENISIDLNESLGGRVYMVSYTSFTATTTSELRSWNYNPFDRYGVNGVSQMEINRLVKYESTRDNS